MLVLDINMPDGSGIEAAREVRRVAPEVAVLMLTMFDDDESVFAAIRAGAIGYVLKGADPKRSLRAIRQLAAGNAIFGPGMARRALAYLSAPPATSRASPAHPARARDPRADRQRARQRDHRHQARACRPNTVANHVTSIFAKLQVASRAEAIVHARNAGLGKPPTH